jgi:hypothetical protein
MNLTASASAADLPSREAILELMLCPGKDDR